MASIAGEGKKKKRGRESKRKSEKAIGREGDSGREFAGGLWGCSHWPQTGTGV